MKDSSSSLIDQCDVCNMQFLHRDGSPDRVGMAHRMAHRQQCMNLRCGTRPVQHGPYPGEEDVSEPTPEERRRSADDLQRLLEELS